jgi:hypothetical protein
MGGVALDPACFKEVCEDGVGETEIWDWIRGLNLVTAAFRCMGSSHLIEIHRSIVVTEVYS